MANNSNKNSRYRRSNKKRRRSKKRNNSKIIIAVIIASVLILAICFIVFLVNRNRPNTTVVSVTDINVLLTNGNNKTWNEITLSCDVGMSWTESGVAHDAKQGESITFSSNRPVGTVIELTPLEGVGRFDINGKGDGYPGKIQLHYTSEGLQVTDYVPLEEYIKGVITSEMPKSYGLEALKAQAICARSYVLCRAETYAYEEAMAQVDDTVSYQVYGNNWAGGDALTAVDETAGVVVKDSEGNIANTWFYSTSCGYSQTQKAAEFPYLARTYISLTGTDPLKKAGVSTADDVVETDNNFEASFSDYIRNADPDALECDTPYFRWEGELNASLLDSSEKGKFKSMTVSKRSTGGAITSITLQFEQGYDIIEGEYNIRKKLGPAVKTVKLNNNSNKDITLLPSSAFSFDKTDEGYKLYGGGFGHGCGMSQNAAKELASEGKSYIDILKFFYKDCKVEHV